MRERINITSAGKQVGKPHETIWQMFRDSEKGSQLNTQTSWILPIDMTYIMLEVEWKRSREL